VCSASETCVVRSRGGLTAHAGVAALNHREAVVEKKLLAAQLEINGLKTGIVAANRIAEQRVRVGAVVLCCVHYANG